MARLIDTRHTWFGRTGSLCGRCRRPTRYIAAEQSAARTKSICSPPSQIALVYRIPVTRDLEGNRPSRIRLRAVHKLSSDRPALRRIGIDLAMREMRCGGLIRARTRLRSGFVAQHHSARERLEHQEAARVATELRWGAVAADLISTNSRQVALLRPSGDSRKCGGCGGACGRRTIALKCRWNRRKLNAPRVIHSCGGPIVPRHCCPQGGADLLGRRPSREGSAGPLANHRNGGAHGRRRIGLTDGATRQASASIFAFCLGDASGPPAVGWPQKYQPPPFVRIAEVRNELGAYPNESRTFRRGSSENTVRYL